MVKTVKDLIIETLDDLKKGDLERFKNKLRDKTFQGHRIGAGKLEDASRVDIANRIVDTFTEQYAVALTVEVLNEIGQNEPARVLQARTAACEINYCYYFLYVRASGNAKVSHPRLFYIYHTIGCCHLQNNTAAVLKCKYNILDTACEINY